MNDHDHMLRLHHRIKRTPAPLKIDRALAIRQHLFARGQSSIAEIATAVGASEPTVRRGLLVLEAEGQILRTHGSARIAEASGVEVAFETREQINFPANRAIGEAAYGMLRPDTAVFLDAGTTVLQLARRLRLNPLSLRSLTNCLPVAQVLMPVPNISVTLLGGTLRPQNASMVGMLAEEALDRLWFDQLFLGAGADQRAHAAQHRHAHRAGRCRKIWNAFNLARGKPASAVSCRDGCPPDRGMARKTGQDRLPDHAGGP